MMQFNLAYRYQSTGVVEGFSGFAFGGEKEAKDVAIRKVINKIAVIQQSQRGNKNWDQDNVEPNYNESRLILTHAGTTAAEKAQIQRDWKISERSNTL